MRGAAQAGGRDALKVAVLGDGSARDVKPLLAEHVREGLVGEAFFGGLGGDEFADPGADARGRDRRAHALGVNGLNGGKKEEASQLLQMR